MAARRRRVSAEQQLAQQLAARLLSTQQGRRALVFLVIIALLAAGGYYLWYYQLRPRHPVGPTVRIATWNLRQFSESRRSLDLPTIASIIRESKFDVVAIQEVKKNGAAVDQLLNVLGVPWRASSFSDITGNHERFVFIYNGDHVTEIGTAHSIATAEAVIFDRVPYQQTFRAGNFDFTLVTCHLYYGEGTEGYQRRQREAQVLAEFASDLAARSAEKDVIVLGDFNETRGHENFGLFVSTGMEILNHEPSNLAGNEVYDSLIIEPKATREWNGVAGAVRFDEVNFANDDKSASTTVSDHRPVYADFVTNLPDDD